MSNTTNDLRLTDKEARELAKHLGFQLTHLEEIGLSGIPVMTLLTAMMKRIEALEAKK